MSKKPSDRGNALYELLLSVIGQISVPKLKNEVERNVAAMLARNGVSRGQSPADQEPDQADGLSATLAQRSQSDPIGDQMAVTRLSISQAQDAAEKIRTERLHQARLSFRVALIMSVVGIVIILAGLVPVLTGVVTAGVVTVVAGTVCEAVGLLAFALSRQANDRLDAINHDLTLLTNTVVISELAGGLSDKRARERAIADAMRALTRANRQQPGR